MSTLHIRLFGQLRVGYAGVPVDAGLPQAAQGLLAYLLLHRGQCHPRELLAERFWGERNNGKARRCLNTAVWRLRSALEPKGVERGAYLVATAADELGFNCASDHWLDVAVFEAQVGQVLACPRQQMQASDLAGLQESVRLYDGELLEGFYDDWVLRERERLRLLYLRCLRRLMQAYRDQGAFEDSLACAQQILACDPLREEIHREAMRLYCDLGQRSLAVRQYQHCREILAGELGILPMEETQALYTRIAGGCGCADKPAVDGPASVDLRMAVQHLRQAVDESVLAQTRLRQALQALEALISSGRDAIQVPKRDELANWEEDSPSGDSFVIEPRLCRDRGMRE